MWDNITMRSEGPRDKEYVPYEKEVHIHKPTTVDDLKFLEEQRTKITEQYLGSMVAKLEGVFQTEILISKFYCPELVCHVRYVICFKTAHGKAQENFDTAETDTDKVIEGIKNKIREMLYRDIEIPLHETFFKAQNNWR